MPNVKNIKPPTKKRKEGAITRAEQNRDRLNAQQLLELAKKQNRPVKVLEKNTHTGETFVYHAT